MYQKRKTLLLALFVFCSFSLQASLGPVDDQKSQEISHNADHYTISNPLVLLTGASKYDSYYTDDKGNRYYLSNLDTVEEEMEILYDVFAAKCDYDVKSTYFDEKGNIVKKYLRCTLQLRREIKKIFC